MGIVHGNWLTGTHSGRACKHEKVYTRVNKKTAVGFFHKKFTKFTKFTHFRVRVYFF